MEFKLSFYKRDDKDNPTMVFECEDWESSSTLLEVDVSVEDLQYFTDQIDHALKTYKIIEKRSKSSYIV